MHHHGILLSGLQHRAAPPLQPAARRLFAFDLEAGAAVRQQKETGRARDHVRASTSNDLVRLGSSERAPNSMSACVLRMTGQKAGVPSRLSRIL
jgi:hypothetical protein